MTQPSNSFTIYPPREFSLRGTLASAAMMGTSLHLFGEPPLKSALASLVAAVAYQYFPEQTKLVVMAIGVPAITASTYNKRSEKSEALLAGAISSLVYDQFSRIPQRPIIGVMHETDPDFINRVQGANPEGQMTLAVISSGTAHSEPCAFISLFNPSAGEATMHQDPGTGLMRIQIPSYAISGQIIQDRQGNTGD